MVDRLDKTAGDFVVSKPTGKAPPGKRAPYRHKKPERAPDTEWLKNRIEESGMSHGYLASRLGLDEAKFSKLLSGNRKIQLEEIVTLAGLLDQPLDRMAARFGYPSTARRIRKTTR